MVKLLHGSGCHGKLSAVSDSDGVIGNTESTQETTESLQDDSTAALADDMNE